jgi:hypothetical protein
MLGLDITNLAVPDYEIIARVERLISALNGTYLQTPVALPVNTMNIPYSHHQMQSANEDLNNYNSESRNMHHRQHHRRSKERSVSPSKHNYHYHSESSSPSREKSKSPLKVTIDPNSY